MDTISFDKLLLKTAFCCMASDGHIDQREVEIIKSMCSNSSLFINFDFEAEINRLVDRINSEGGEFINKYFQLLKSSILSSDEELTLLDFAINTIRADEQIEYAEIKFFKIIWHHLAISEEIVTTKFPEIEPYLEEDIETDSYLDKISKQFLASTNFPQFDSITTVNLQANE